MLSFMSCMLDFMVCILELRWSKSDFDRDGEVGELAGAIDSDSLHVLDMERVFLDGSIFRNIYWLGLLFDLKIINL